MNVEFTDNSIQIKDALTNAIESALYEIGGAVQRRAVDNSRTDTGQLRGSWKYVVDEQNQEVQIGSPLENAIWEEFGTGIHADNQNGRKTPWRYVDRKGQWHTTKGKQPNRTLHKSIDPIKNKIQTVLENKIKGALGK